MGKINKKVISKRSKKRVLKKEDVHENKDQDQDNILDQEGDGNKPEFYIDEEDGDLINNENSENDNSEAEAGSELDFGEEDYIASEDEEETSQNKYEKEEKKEKKLTKLKLKKIINKCKQGSVMGITKMIILFTKVTNSKTDNLEEDDILNKSKIITGLIKFYIKNLPDILLLKLHSINKKGEKENNLETKSSLVKNLIKRYLSALTKYLKSTETAMVSLVFKYIETISELILNFKNFTEVFLKLGSKIWAERHGTNSSNNALSFIMKILDKKPEYFEDALKLLYVNYLDVAKAMNWNTFESISQMQEEIINLLSLDFPRAYITIFTFIRKLCLQLRTTLSDKKFASIKNIYNWQFINAIKLWARVVCKYYKKKNCEINLLAYPLIQTILGVLRLNLVDTFFPLRIILTNLLNEISMSTNIYIPVSSYLMEILESSNFKNKFREKNVTSNEDFPDINVNLKFKKDKFKHYGFVNYLLEQVLDSLTEYLSINSYKFSFPEIAFGVIHNLKKLIKTVQDKNFREMIKSLIDKINSSSNYIEEKRKQRGLILLDINKIRVFEDELKNDKSNELIYMIEKINIKRKGYIQSRKVQVEDKFIEI